MAKLELMPFNEAQIRKDLKDLKIHEKGDQVVTEYKGHLMSTTPLTDRYGIFDFGKFTSEILDPVLTYFKPKDYRLDIHSGFQEMRLIGEDIKVSGDTYRRMLSFISSSNKERALSLQIGLFRQICSNGAVIGDPNESMSLKTKHFKQILEEKIKEFSDQISHLGDNFNKQVAFIEALQGVTVDFKKLAKALVRNEDFTHKPSGLINLKCLASKLLNSETDKLANLKESQIKILKNTEVLLDSKSKVNMEIEAYQLFNCWTEIFRNRDAAKIQKESTRMYRLIELAKKN